LRREDDPALRFWLRWLAIGSLVVAAAYFMFLGSHLHPLDPGIDNRINVFAGIGVCLLVYAIVACAAHLVLASRPAAAALALGLVAVIAIGYGVRLVNDEVNWRDAADRQTEILTGAEAALSSLSQDSTVLSFGEPAQAAPGVPIFYRPWDLGGALELRSEGAVTSAYPVYEGVSVSCRRQLVVDGGGGYGRFELTYRRLYFGDLEVGLTPVDSPATCAAALRRLRPGPLEP
jgi:hypothetical protein